MSTNMECSKLKIPVYRYFNDEQISGTQDFRYVCLQPGCPKMEGEMKMPLVTEKKRTVTKLFITYIQHAIWVVIH